MGAAVKIIEQSEQVDRDLVAEAVQSAVEQAGGDLLKALPILEDAVGKDSLLFSALMDDYVHHACWDQLRKHAHRERKVIWMAPNSDNKGRGERIKYMAKANLDNLFGFRLPLPGLPTLGSCNWHQVKEAASAYYSRVQDMSQKANFLNYILELPRFVKNKNKTTQQVLELDEIQKAYDKAHVE